VAYIGYDAGVRAKPARARPARFKLAWGRLAAVAASLMVWIGLIATARAIF
jgi:hypothetical protein